MLAIQQKNSHKRQSRKNVGFFTASNQNEGLTHMTEFSYTSIIWLTQGKYTIVDNDDYPYLTKFKWFAAKYGARGHLYYAKRGNNTKLHCVIFPTCKFIDHINGNGLDNRKINLRSCTRAENLKNTKPRSKSGLKGVSFGRGGGFEAHVTMNKERIHLGTFHDKNLAGKIRDVHALSLDPIYSRVNFNLSPDEQSELFEYHAYYMTTRRKPRNSIIKNGGIY